MASMKSPSAVRILRFLGGATTAAGPVPRWANRGKATAKVSKTGTRSGVRLRIAMNNMVPRARGVSGARPPEIGFLRVFGHHFDRHGRELAVAHAQLDQMHAGADFIGQTKI